MSIITADRMCKLVYLHRHVQGSVGHGYGYAFPCILFWSLLASCAAPPVVHEGDRLQVTLEVYRQLQAKIRGPAPKVTCVGIRREVPDKVALDETLIDPDPEIVEQLADEFAGIRAISECEFVDVPDRIGPEVRERLTGNLGVALWVSEVRELSEIRAGYHAHGLAAGEWMCGAEQRKGSWVVHCNPEWVA